MNKQISHIDYSLLNLPEHIQFSTIYQRNIFYLYDAAGRKLRKQTKKFDAILNTTDYDGSFVYTTNNTLEYILTPEGRALPDGSSFKYEYYLKDHLGNTRVVFDQAGTVLQDNSYYPFGMKFEGLAYQTTATSSPNKYLYNGKEYQDDFGLGWYDYGARFYDAVLGRWHSVDPMAEKNHSQSPFVYCSNNPIVRIDPTGALDGWYEDESNILRYDKDIHSQKDMKESNISGTFLGEQVLGHLSDGKGFAGYADGSYALSLQPTIINERPYDGLAAANAFCDGFAKALVGVAVVSLASAATTISTSYWGLKAALVVSHKQL